MKQIFLLSVLIFAFRSVAQDSSFCYNSGIVISYTERLTETEEVVPDQEHTLILMPYVMKEKEVLLFIKEKNNSELNRLFKKVKLAKTFQNIGFTAIPEALIGGGLIGAAATSNQGSVEQKSIGIGLIALSGVCLTSSLCFKFIRTKNYKKAIAKYNLLYN
ncbi:MAG: hypothetical protein IPJ32_12770 [Sphingobacteriaceae bacterium]|nr:hypothetical protein [Sphingobacteriaceae bacterium]